MKSLLNISQLAAMIAGNALPTCAVRTAWNYVDKNPSIIQRIKRGQFSLFSVKQAKALCSAIIKGKAAR